MEQAGAQTEQAKVPETSVGRWIAAGLMACVIGGPALWFSVAALFADKPEIEACEKYVLGNLRSPASYERVSARSTRVDGQQWVTIVYDAANAYGARIRETELCKFRITGGQVAVPHVIDPDLARELRRLDELTGRRREPCCLD